MKAVTLRSGKETESAMTEEIIAYSGAPLNELTENFDNPTSLTPSYSNGAWSLTTAASVSAPNSLTDSPDGNYPEGNYYILFAPVIISSINPTISFEHIALIDESSADMGVLTVSNDFGNTWNDIIWVDRNTDPENFKSDLASSNWAPFHRTLSQYIGDTLYIKFLIFANRFRNDDGWYIDDLRLDDDPNTAEQTNIASKIKASVNPNPSNGYATLSMSIPVATQIDIRLYDNLGNELAVLAQGAYTPGTVNLPVQLSANAAGIYYCRINTGSGTKTIPFVIAR
jgi:hypothetical protein